jgi:hypothetical protein
MSSFQVPDAPTEGFQHMKRILIFILFLCASSVAMTGCDQENAALQERCKNEGEAYFKAVFGDRVFDNKDRAGSISYRTHFNKKRGQCYIVLDENGYERRADKLYEKKILLTPVDRKQHAFFYNIGKSTICDVAGQACRSEDEWDRLVKPYMKE